MAARDTPAGSGPAAGSEEVLDVQQQEELESRTAQHRKQHWSYLGARPELRELLNDFLSATLFHKPDDVFQFAAEHFRMFTDADEAEQVEQGDQPATAQPPAASSTQPAGDQKAADSQPAEPAAGS